MNILLVAPHTPETFWSFRHALPFVSKRAVLPPLGLLTVAAMLPRDWKLKLVDLNVSRLKDTDIEWADYVFLSGMIIEAESAHRVAARCREKGRTVIAGGPLFTTGHEGFPEIDYFVLGESEALMPELVADMTAGTLKHTYQAVAKPDVTTTPVPRWDLIRFKDYVIMPVQFSRGCPFNCEFCDIIVMYGRVPRVKSSEQVIRELDALVDAGWTGSVFIVDDNFIGHKPRAFALLREIAAWRDRRAPEIFFMTEASLNLADSQELLSLMARAGFKRVFVGIETPDEDSLKECGKVQNTRRSMSESVRRIQNAGMEVMGGFIVGFDHDGESIFERQWRFIQESGIVTAMVGLLTALPQTQLFHRLQKQGRLLAASTGNNVDAVLNFIPHLDREVLVNGYRALVHRLYAPKAYYQRSLAFLREYRPTERPPRMTHVEMTAFLRSLWIIGVWSRGRRAFWKYFAQVLLKHREALSEAVHLAIWGVHFRKVAERI